MAAYMSMGEKEKKNIEEKLREEILNLAQSGDVFAQRIMAEIFGNGYGFSVDNRAAFEYNSKSADGGFTDAMTELALCYVEGKRDVEKDEIKAAKWYQKAASRGDAHGQRNWGLCHWLGVGVPKDCFEAVNWFRKGAEQGHMMAQVNLAGAYENGDGVRRDIYEAEKWYRKAAEQGHADSQCKLGFAYIYEQLGLREDYCEGAKWYTKAAKQGYAKAQYVIR